MPTSEYSHAPWMAMFGVFWLLWVLFICAVVVFTIVCYWRIATKAGYSGVLSLLMLVPLVNIIVLIYFAFSEWPIEQQLRMRGGAPPSAAAPGTSVMPT